MMKPGQCLAEEDFPGPEGSHQQLVESALLALAGDRKGGHQGGDHQGQQANDARHDEPAAQQVGIEPGPEFQTGRAARAAGPLLPIGIEAGDDRVDVAEQDRRRVGVAAVHDHLHRARAAAEQFAAELGADVQDHEHTLGVHLRGDFRLVRDDRHLPEIGRGVEAGDQVARRPGRGLHYRPRTECG